MKKKFLLTTAFVTLGLLVTSFAVPKIKNNSNASELITRPDCETLFRNYESISEILTAEYAKANHQSTDVHQTWGTVTAVYTQSKKYHAFIQNTGADGKSAGMCLYNLSSTSSDSPVSVGDFVTANGYLSYYQGMYELDMSKAGNTFTVEKNIESYDVDSEVLDVKHLTATCGTNEWNENAVKGTIRVQLNNATVTNVTNNSATINYNGSNVEIFVGSIGTQTAILNKLKTARSNSLKTNITGYLQIFDKSGSEKTQILIRYDTDITLLPSETVSIASIDFANSTLEMAVGTSTKAQVSVEPTYASVNGLGWQVADEEIAEVSGDGTITAKKTGVTTITAFSKADNYINKSFTLVVKGDDYVYVSEIVVDTTGTEPTGYGPLLTTPVNSDGYIYYNVLPVNATNPSVKFCSDNDDVVAVNENNGWWWAVKTGFAIIYVVSVENEEIYATYCINVYSISGIELEEINVDRDVVEMEVGDTVEVQVTTVPSSFDVSSLTVESYFEVTIAREWGPEWSTPSNLSFSMNSDGVLSITGVEQGNDLLTIYFDNDEFRDICAQIDVTVNEKYNPITEDTINLGNINVGSYNTNFCFKNAGTYGLKFGCYRLGKESGCLVFYPSANLITPDSNSLCSAFYNETTKYAISSMEISYVGSATLRYGATKDCSNSTALNYKGSKGTMTVNTNDAYFFYLESNLNTEFKCYDIKFTYNTSKQYTGQITPYSRVNTRIPATVYSGELVDGVSYVDVPTDVTITGNKYTVNKTKRYTYYSYSYAYANRGTLNLDNVAMTDPVDVANYYIAFGCAPANYASKGTVTAIKNTMGSDTNVSNLFGKKARYVSQYNRTDGYAIGLPYDCYPDNTTPTYLEFDFDGNGEYTFSKRDVCRVVLWASGWRGTGYEKNVPVATYTDDHYVTFREYNNYGGWNLPFDSKENGSYTQMRSFYYYGSTNTLIRA